MAASPLDTVAEALRQAEQDGYERGYATAVSDLGGRNASLRVAQVLADATESAALHFRDDPVFAEALKRHADRIRRSSEPPKVKGKPGWHGGGFVVRFEGDVDHDGDAPALTLRAASGGPALNADVVYDRETRTLTLTPHNDLSDGVEYVATLQGVRSADGGAELLEPQEWRFAHGAAKR